MKWRTFWQIVGLIIIAGAIFYKVAPKYNYIDDQTPDLLRFNKIKGTLEVCKDGEHWYRVVSKSVVKVERPTISYEEFMQGRRQFQEVLQSLEMMKEKIEKKINKNK